MSSFKYSRFKRRLSSRFRTFTHVTTYIFFCSAFRSGETCSHLVGFITALSNWQLMGLTEVPAELPCTSLPQRWSIPRGTKIEPEAVPHMIFINPKPERKKRPIKNTLTDNRYIPWQMMSIFFFNYKIKKNKYKTFLEGCRQGCRILMQVILPSSLGRLPLWVYFGSKKKKKNA